MLVAAMRGHLVGRDENNIYVTRKLASKLASFDSKKDRSFNISKVSSIKAFFSKGNNKDNHS